MAYIEAEAQKLVTEPIVDLIEFDFTSIGRTEKVYLASSLQTGSGPQTGQQVKFQWQVNDYEHIDFKASGFLSDLTGSTAEPELTVSADLLYALSSWPNIDLIEYRGVIVKRRRVFVSSSEAVQPQTYFIKKVNELTSSTITFVLTPNRSTERLNRKSSNILDL
jgi:phage-related protein